MTLIAGIDTETTGLLDPEHRLIEVYIGLWRDGRRVFEYERRIDPERSIAADAERVHGISYADLVGKPKWDEVAPNVVRVLEKADHYVIHNAEFDVGFLTQELERVGLRLPARPVTDTMADAVWATHDGKKPRLAELCFACGEPYDPALAHAAAYDVDRMMACYFKGVAWGFFTPVPTVSAATPVQSSRAPSLCDV